MMKKISLITPLLILGCILQSGLSQAEEARGTILKTSGVVKIINEQGEAHNVTGTNVIVHEMETVSTGEGGQAVVQFNDGALSVLDERSSLKVGEKNWLSHLGGKIYFTFRKVFSEDWRVKTKFSTIGVRGTTFIVYDNKEEGEGVALQEGELEFESSSYGYQIHRIRDPDDFETFKQRAHEGSKTLEKDYEAYKKAALKGFYEYKKKFTLTPNYKVKFKGSVVSETEMTDKDMAAFSNFESVAGELLEAFHRHSKEQGESQQGGQKEGS